MTDTSQKQSKAQFLMKRLKRIKLWILSLFYQERNMSASTSPYSHLILRYEVFMKQYLLLCIQDTVS